MRMLCLGVPAVLSNKYFGPEDGGLFNEMMARLEVMFGELDVYSQRGDEGISQEEVVPLQQVLDLSEGLDASSFTEFVKTIDDEKTKKAFEKLDPKIGAANLRKYTNELGFRSRMKLKTAAANPAVEHVVDSAL